MLLISVEWFSAIITALVVSDRVATGIGAELAR
jgi:hypothetical protein